MEKRRARLWKIKSEEFKNVILNSNSYSEIAKHFNYSINSSIYDMIKERMKHEGIPLSVIEEAQKKQRQIQIKELCQENKIPLEKILVKNSSYDRGHLKNRLLKEGLLEEKCYKCGLGTEWQGEPLTLQLDHKNGIKDDNRLENLHLLCPNCHSQTVTFAGKQRVALNKCIDCGNKVGKKHKRCMTCANRLKALKQKKESPERRLLIELILTSSFVKIGEIYNVSDNTVRNWCKNENLPYKKDDIEFQRQTLEKELADATLTV